MKFLGLAILAALALAGCTPHPYSGAGTTSTGEPVTGTRYSHAGFREDLKFTSVQGWTCEGTVHLYEMYHAGQTSTQFPVTCDNGTKGTVTVAYAKYLRDQLRAGDIHYSFILDNGVMGQFRI